MKSIEQNSKSLSERALVAKLTKFNISGKTPKKVLEAFTVTRPNIQAAENH